jgi:hypothetical protein
MGKSHQRDIMTDWVKKDFDEVKKQLKTQYHHDISSVDEPFIKKLHSDIYSIVSLIYELEKQDADRVEFLNEVHSDLIHALICITMGLKKPFFLSIRSTIEHILKYIFYKDHPIEYQLLSDTSDNKETIQDMISYVLKHPKYCKIKDFDKIMSKLKSEYEDKSKIIHGTSPKYLQLNKTISEIKLETNEIQDYVNNFSKIAELLLLVLIIFHWKEYQKVDSQKQSVIMTKISNPYKKILMKI